MNFNNTEFKSFREDVNAALKTVADKYGVTIEAGKIKYSDYDFDMTLKVIKNDGNTDGKREIFEEQCKLYGFTPEDYNREFSIKNHTYRLIGFNPRAKKNFCTIQSTTTNALYSCHGDVVKRNFARKAM